ncbi:MAG: transporter substrate-binding domain-containing protein [Campylobacteraceae bacterium]|nr:transporter substrate-binding domain-containing protein [Campylobacteraceae bacterium]
MKFKKMFLVISISFLSLVAAPIKIGMSPDYPPFGYLEGDKMAGFDVEFAQMLFKELGLEYVIVPTMYPDICSKISSGELDIGISAMGIDENTVGCDYSVSYYESVNMYVTSASSGIKSKEDLAGKKIGYFYDGAQMYRELIAEIPMARGYPKTNVSSMILSLFENRLDAIIVDSTGVIPFVKGNYDYLDKLERSAFDLAVSLGVNTKLVVIHEEPSPEAQTIISFPKNRLGELKTDINQVIIKFRENNAFQPLLEKYDLILN